MTSLNVTEADSLATLQAALDAGINFFDTAFCYGADGESEKLIARALGARRNELVIATKGGIHWDANLDRQLDARPPPAQIEETADAMRWRLGEEHRARIDAALKRRGTPVSRSAL